MRTSVVAGYFDQEGVVLNTDYERFSLRINSDYKASEKISMGFNIAPQYVRDNTPRTDGSRGTGILFNALHAWPNMPIYDDNGELTYYNRFPSETGNIFAYPNYVRSALEITNETKQTNLLSNAYVQYEPIEGLVVKSTINAEIRNSKFFNFTPSTASAGINIALPAVASSIRDHYENFSWLNENTVTYSKSINDHNFQLLGGFTNQKFRRERTRVAADTYADDRLPTIQGAININRGGTLSDVQEWSLTSFFLG